LAGFCLVAVAVAVGMLRIVSAGQPAPPAHAATMPTVSPGPASVVSPGSQHSPTRVPELASRHHLTAIAQAGDHWRHVLTRLSSIRALAWRRGSVRLLERIYVAGAAELRIDERMLHRYAVRGLRVRGAELVFGSLRVTSRNQRTARLTVVDQLRRAVAVGRGGARLRLPSDLPSRHRIVLAKTAQGWRIASATAAAS
jgi:hypothetical protein